MGDVIRDKKWILMAPKEFKHKRNGNVVHRNTERFAYLFNQKNLRSSIFRAAKSSINAKTTTVPYRVPLVHSQCHSLLQYNHASCSKNMTGISAAF